ncbi:MAG: hypothetical protein A2031_08230 [Deltaproteobacteria bacterium RBG_19FT_COMBO_43_11]|nr:MAG: hypothetical protein A2W27_08245 [Deltaproteobacteria bacterium RBG_16_44_11]OGP87182.1 MAG: hypothetical protein A2031_08230 [Deltaproteobacteria bacterium RBG_19FT_COMBO_43_11]
MSEKSFTIPKNLQWSVEDWKDLYFTLCRFKKRFLARQTTIKLKKEEIKNVIFTKHEMRKLY